MINKTISDCGILHLPRINNRLGNLTSIENLKNIPFEVKRIYYLYDIPGGESRGGHGHKLLESVIIAVSGSFDVTLDDAVNKKKIQLNRPFIGLNVKPGMWREITNFSSGAICLVLASDFYDMEDYIRDYSDFLDFKK